MRPASGRTSPAIMLTSVVLPAPDGPNSPVTGPSLSNAMARSRSPTAYAGQGRAPSFPVQPACRAACEEFGRQQRRHCDHDGDDHKAQRGGVTRRRLRIGIDRGRDRLGFARDIRHEGDGRAEFAQRLGEAQQRAGDDARASRAAASPWRNARTVLAPRVAAASSSLRSIASNEIRIGRTSSGNAMIPQASAAPVQRNDNTMPNVSYRKLPIGPRRPNEISSR